MFDTTPQLDCAGRMLKLDHVRVMGIVNVTPDSFSDGGAHVTPDAAVAHGLLLAGQGADILDVGGESTRPGAAAVPLQEELRRVLPVIERLARETALPISVDTSHPEVMRAAVAAGAGFINDVRALQAPDALHVAAQLGVPICVAHMQGEPRSMQQTPQYADVVEDVHRFLAERLFACELEGISKSRVFVDPGFGFGKTLEHNLALLRALPRLAGLGAGLMVGLSRKSMIGALTGVADASARVVGSTAAALLAAQRGARIVRVHDVAATRQALAVWQALAEPPMTATVTKPAVPRWPDDD
ncbi:dihydropteroate synthase [Metallibacterium scheffleri]|uniref:dihydropteroate synthase n=1 Tax=Metallibacterium scheffleri TaxID=993689 RepID=UPI0026EF895C|nr:dihydropteroate synthase [Metallibacterium scheffleri]MBW8074669.1 dihydropteroate synthase [Metallibacterium scheffleri]